MKNLLKQRYAFYDRCHRCFELVLLTADELESISNDVVTHHSPQRCLLAVSRSVPPC